MLATWSIPSSELNEEARRNNGTITNGNYISENSFGTKTSHSYLGLIDSTLNHYQVKIRETFSNKM